MEKLANQMNQARAEMLGFSPAGWQRLSPALQGDLVSYASTARKYYQRRYALVLAGVLLAGVAIGRWMR